MVIPDDQKLEIALKTFEALTGEATHFWFAAATMNEVATVNKATLTALNVTPSFWITARVAMECQAIIAVGKIFGPRKTNPYNIDYLFQVVTECLPTVFSKSALAARKRRMSANADEWLPQFMEGVHVPDVEEITALRKLSKAHRKTYENQWKQIRDEHVAHTSIIDPNVRWEMFQKARVNDMEGLIGFLNQLRDVLWRMYYNGERPTFDRPVDCSVSALVAKTLEDLSRIRTQDHIVAETRKCLALFTDAVASGPSRS